MYDRMVGINKPTPQKDKENRMKNVDLIDRFLKAGVKVQHIQDFGYLAISKKFNAQWRDEDGKAVNVRIQLNDPGVEPLSICTPDTIGKAVRWTLCTV